MDADAKKTALRMIPYGLYILTSEAKDGRVAAATVNWVTQASFAPPLVVVGVKADSGAHDIIKESGSFVLNVLGKGQQGQAFTFSSRWSGKAIASAVRRFPPAPPGLRSWPAHRPSSNASSWIRWRRATTRSSSARWWTRACAAKSKDAPTTPRSS